MAMSVRGPSPAPTATLRRSRSIRNYRDRIRQCETLGEYAMGEQIRQILMQEAQASVTLRALARLGL
jgi:hypothetical protein